MWWSFVDFIGIAVFCLILFCLLAGAWMVIDQWDHVWSALKNAWTGNHLQ